jgi:hypothetical protein
MSFASCGFDWYMAHIVQWGRGTSGGSFMKALLASLLALAVQAVVSSSAHAFPISFAIDLSFPFEPAPVEGALSGTFRDAGVFRVESSLLPARGPAVLSLGQISDFNLTLPDFAVTRQDVDQGTCLSADRLPVCGFLFSNGQLLGLVGQYAMPTSDVRFAFRLDNTSPTVFDPGAIFQSVSIDNLDLGFTVASGFVSFRPIPEPASVLLFLAGSGAVGVALRRRGRPRPIRGAR